MVKAICRVAQVINHPPTRSAVEWRAFWLLAPPLVLAIVGLPLSFKVSMVGWGLTFVGAIAYVALMIRDYQRKWSS